MEIPDLERLVTLTMPFGKYKGRLISDLPGHYLNWMAREGFPRGEIGRLLALMHEIDHNGLRDLLEPLSKRGQNQSGATATVNHTGSPRRSGGDRRS
ncbi:DUF3820 family protein [Paraburkholderia dinghuensis]|uniref:Cytoplasmic protein n=1 Tax=Paraburkholderia dinghuensis TaxID=2305225 RepID=A0A3N6MLQ2_9BURK|nr:DUF3820 family protein [Paraburkholderia dinghuensis]RQH04398.1 hypothetical protein D1Y85_18210 [Paraburkholderia dinghuensis]